MGLDGIVLLDKPEGITSRKAVDVIMKILGIKKGGHFGSLDPFATGLLCVGIGNGTKLLPFIEDNIKEYIALIGLEKFTDTDDITGNEIQVFSNISPDKGKVDEWINCNTGVINQLPPVFCAQKHGGKPLYRLKRQNKEVCPRHKQVTVYNMEILSIGDTEIEMRVVCSRGTYIRSLARDLGQYLGCGGYLRELRRLKSEGFSVNDAFTVEQIKQRVSEDKTFLIPMSEAVRLPTAVVNGTGKEDIRNGRPVLMTNMIDDVRAEEDSLVAVLDENRNLLCIARVHRSGGVFGYIERGFY